MLLECIDKLKLYLIAPRENFAHEILDRLRKHEEGVELGRQGFPDEQLWTVLFTYGFVAPNAPVEKGFAALSTVLTEGQCRWIPARHAWLEMLPMPPREGNHGESEIHTEVDLVVGDQEIRNGAKSVVHFKPTATPSWICMVEAKWLSDIACKTEYDSQRNQLVRLIETALTFQNPSFDPPFPDQVHVTLLTPAVFKHHWDGSGSRLYFYKFREYSEQPEVILRDIEGAKIEKRADSPDWKYPEDLASRLSRLRLHWVTYEALFNAMPDSTFRRRFTTFIKETSPGVISV
jgi:hypothetical protein